MGRDLDARGSYDRSRARLHAPPRGTAPRTRSTPQREHTATIANRQVVKFESAPRGQERAVCFATQRGLVRAPCVRPLGRHMSIYGEVSDGLESSAAGSAPGANESKTTALDNLTDEQKKHGAVVAG